MNPRPPDPAPTDSARHGVLLALLAGVLLGVTVPFAKRAFAPPMPPMFAAAWLYVTAGLAFLPAVLARRPAPARRLVRRDLRFVLSAALIGCVAAPYAYVRGLTALPSYVVGLLVNLEAVFGVLVAIICFHERVGRRRRAGLLLLIAGAVLTAALSTRGGGDGASGSTLAGVLWIAAACLAWAFDTNLLAPVSARDPRAILVIHNFVGGAIAFLVSGCLGAWWPSVPGETLALGAAVGVVGYGLSLWLILRALACLGAARTNAIFLVTSAITAVVASALVLHESIPLWILGSLALLQGGVRLVASAEPEEPSGGASGGEGDAPGTSA